MSAPAMWVALCVFALVMIVLGYLGHRGTTSTMEDFVLGSRKLGMLPAFFTVTATLFSAFSYFGIIGQYYSSGLGAWIQVATTAAVGPILYFAGTRIWLVAKKYGFVNVTEYLSDRYKSPAVGLVAGLIMIAALVPYMGAQFRGSGLTLEAVTGGGIPFWAGAVFLAVVVTLYVMSGGFRSVVWTDVIQGALMYVLLIVAMVLLLVTTKGSVGDLMQAVEDERAGLLSNPGADGTFGLPYLISVLVIFAAAHFTMPQLQQRWMAARSHRTLKFTALSLPVGTAIIYMCGFYIAMVGVVQRPNLETPEAIYPTLIADVMPQWLLVIAILAIIAATGSTANSIVLTLSSIVANEYYRPLVAKRDTNRSHDKLVTTVTRVMLPILVAGGLLVAFYGPATIIEIIVAITWPAVFLIFPTLFAGLYWRRATAVAAVASMVVSEVLFLSLHLGWLPIDLAGWHPAIPAGILGVLVLVVGSLVTAPPPQEHLDRHFAMFDPAEPQPTNA
ncbi:MAG: hypothetical protein GEV07_08130 [Streptosporangiales bacterium]|nr:hypothetical protein [Streptosporangiales bacterium]